MSSKYVCVCAFVCISDMHLLSYMYTVYLHHMKIPFDYGTSTCVHVAVIVCVEGGGTNVGC